MNSEEPDLPHAWSVWECSGCGVVMETEAEIAMHLSRKENYSEEPIELQLTAKSDAEETIQEVRQAERQRILDKIKDKREKFNNGRSNEYPQTVLTELLQKIRRSVTHD